MWPFSRPTTPARPDPTEACSFCRRPRAQVANLVAGDVASICDDCIVQSVEILGAVEREPPSVAPVVLRVVLKELAALPDLAPYAASGPLLGAAAALASTPADVNAVVAQAARLRHGAPVLTMLDRPDATPTMKANAASFLISAGRPARARELLLGVDAAALPAEDRAQRAINLASALLAEGAPVEEAEPWLAEADRALAETTDPRYAPAWAMCVHQSRGDVALRRGDALTARSFYERALSGPQAQGPDQRWRLGDALYALGEREAARVEWRTALEARHPEEWVAAEIRRRLAESDTLGG